MREVRTKAEVDEILRLPYAVVFKHSTRCPISSRAQSMVQAFAETRPELPIFLLLVVESREASLYLAERVGVTHQSPQLLALREGRAERHVSHFDITTSWMEKL